MKKLLELLGIILLTGNAVGPLVANKPNNKAKIKNSLETLNRQKRQAPPTNEQQPLPSTAGQCKNLSTIIKDKERDLGVLPDDSEETILNRIKKLNPDVNADINQVTIEKQNNSNNSIYIKYLSTDIYFGKVLCTFIPADFISEELILDGSYADNIQNMLKEFVKNNQIDPLRMINNEGIIRTDYFDTPDKIKERADNLKIIEKLEEILQLSKFDANKIRILVLTLKNKDSDNKLSLVIDLANFYVLGVINNQNQYFYFNDNLEEVRQQQIKRIENWVKELKNENEDEKITAKITKWEKELKKIKSNDEKNRITKKQNKLRNINKAIIENYNFQENNFNLDYTGDYNEEGLDVIIREKKDSDEGKDITISQKTLKDAIANLATYTKEQNEEFKKLKDRLDRRTQDVTVEEQIKDKLKKLQTIKDDLVRMIFVTSEAMRFGSRLKYFNYYKDETKKEQFEFKNIQAYVQEVINDLKKSINWKDYTSQLRGGWTKSSKFVEEQRKGIFKKLNEGIVVVEFISENNEELNAIFKVSLNPEHNWETNVKPKIKSIIENSQNKEYINLLNVILQYLKNLFIANQKEREFLQYNNNTSIPGVIRFINTDRNYNLIRSVIAQGNLDLLELIITKEPQLINVNNNDLTFLQVAIANNKIDIVKWLLANANGANVNEEGKYDSTPLYTATFYGYLDIVKLLLENGANVNARAKNVNIPLHVAIDRGYLDIVSLLLNNGANVNTKNNNGEPPLSTTIIFLGNLDIVKLLLEKGADVNIKDNFGQSPLHLAAHKGHLEIIKLLLAKGADVNAQDIKGITPLQKATDEGHTEVINLLENFVKIKNKIKSLNKQLEKTQNDGQKTKIKNDLQEIQKELEQLLKIKLSDFITQTQLGKIPDNSSQTILNTFIEKNEKIKKLGILPGQLYVQNITDNLADIISPAPNIYAGTVKVTFTLAKKSSKPSRTQKTITEDEYKKQGARPKESTVASKQSDNKKSSSINVSGIGNSQQSSDTQNKNTTTTNQNNLYDVPADNSCLFWSASTSYLLPSRNNNEEFRNRFIQLFGEENLKYLLHIQKLLQQYDLEDNRNLNQLWYQDQTANNLVINFFRNRVVDYIQSNLDTIPNRNGELTFRNLIQDNNDIDTNYLEIMRQPSTWGGTPEIIAMSNLLNANIFVGTDSPYQPVNQNANNNNIAISYVELTKGSGIHNHYNFALIPEEDRTNHPIAIDDNQGNIPVIETTNRQDNLPPTTTKPDSKTIKLPIDDHGQYHAILSNNNEDDDANHGNNIINSQISTTTKAINKYNSLSKEEKLKRLNEINRYYQTLPENDKKTFKEKLTNTGLAALSGGALTAYGTKMTVSGTAAAATSVTNAEAMEMTPLLSTSTTESLAAAETITVAETAAVEGGVIAGETGTAAALAPETLGLSLVIGGLAIAGTWMYFAFHHHATSDIALPASIHHNVYDNIEKWYKFLAHDKLKIKINKNTWNEIKQNKNSPANITKIIKNKFVINDHSGWGGSVTNEDFNTFVKVIVLHFEQINGYFEILDNENDGFVIITNTEGDWLGIE